MFPATQLVRHIFLIRWLELRKKLIDFNEFLFRRAAYKLRTLLVYEMLLGDLTAKKRRRSPRIN